MNNFMPKNFETLDIMGKLTQDEVKNIIISIN